MAYLAIDPEITQADLAVLRASPYSSTDSRNEASSTVPGSRVQGRRKPVQITDDGHRALDTVCDVALFTNDLTDAGLTTKESLELNRLLGKIVHATDGTKVDGFYKYEHSASTI